MPGQITEGPVDDAVVRMMAEEASEDEVDLSVGDPDEPMPDLLVESAVASLRAHRTGYTPKLGLSSLRTAVADDVAAHTGFRPAGEDVVITVGGTGAVAVGLAATGIDDTGTRHGVVVPDPAWPNYRVLAARLGIPVHRYDQGPSGDGFADLEQIGRGLAAGARVVVVCSPSNPTGAVASASALADVVALARRHGAWVLTDEAYESVLTRGDRAPSALSGGGHDVTLAARTFSKTYSMTGLRVGALVAPPALRSAVAALHGTTAGCAPITAQLVALEALRALPDRRAHLAARFRARFVAAAEILGDWAPSDPVDSLGGFYLWLDVRRTGRPSVAVCDELRAAGVIASAGTVYSAHDGWLRLALTAPDDDLDRALRMVRRVLDRLVTP